MIPRCSTAPGSGPLSHARVSRPQGCRHPPGWNPPGPAACSWGCGAPLPSPQWPAVAAMRKSPCAATEGAARHQIVGLLQHRGFSGKEKRQTEQKRRKTPRRGKSSAAVADLQILAGDLIQLLQHFAAAGLVVPCHVPGMVDDAFLRRQEAVEVSEGVPVQPKQASGINWSAPARPGPGLHAPARTHE